MKAAERLTSAMHGVGLLDLERCARNGEFSDFLGPDAMPKWR